MGFFFFFSLSILRLLKMVRFFHIVPPNDATFPPGGTVFKQFVWLPNSFFKQLKTTNDDNAVLISGLPADRGP